MYRLAQTHFKKADRKLYRESLKHKIANIRRSSDVFGDLAFSIVNQQLSGKAAQTIYKRLEEKAKPKTQNSKLKGKSKKWEGKRSKKPVITPYVILKLSPKSLRSCGLSEAKVKALKGLARAAADGTIDFKVLHKHPDEKAIELLTSLRGIGPWTAEMILMFSLGRTDIFSKGDLGLRKGIMRLYGLKKIPSDRFMDRLAKKWSPYRTYAAKVIWRVADEGKEGK